MPTLLTFYRQTWWLWLLFLSVFIALSYYVTPLFVLMIPGLILYSAYFGIVRTSELRERMAIEARSTAGAAGRH